MPPSEILAEQWSNFFATEYDNGGFMPLEQTESDATVEALVRHHGAYIVSAHVGMTALLGSPGFNPYNPGLALPADSTGKIDASHTASPAGSMPGQTIPPHGDSRLTRYDIISNLARDSVDLHAPDESQHLDHHKNIRLLPNGLAVVDRLVNNAAPSTNSPVELNAVHTSLLQHFYIPVAQGDIAGIEILGDDGRPENVKLQPEDGPALRGSFADIADGLAEGETYIHEQFFYSTKSFRFPDGRQIAIGAQGRASDSPNAGTALAFWRRPGTDSICIEPITGVRVSGKGRGDIQNNTIYIPPSGYLSLTSSIRLKSVS